MLLCTHMLNSSTPLRPNACRLWDDFNIPITSQAQLDQGAGSVEWPSSSGLSGWLVLGVSTQLSRVPKDQNIESSSDSPSSSDDVRAVETS